MVYLDALYVTVFETERILSTNADDDEDEEFLFRHVDLNQGKQTDEDEECDDEEDV